MRMEAANCKSWSREGAQLETKQFIHGAKTLIPGNKETTVSYTQNSEEMKSQVEVSSIRSQPEKRLPETDCVPSSSNFFTAPLETRPVPHKGKRQLEESSSMCAAKSSEACVHPIAKFMPGAKRLKPDLEQRELEPGQAISILIELCHKRRWNFLHDYVEPGGQAHATSFTVEVKLAAQTGEIVESASGTGKNKKEAKKLAAIEILKKLRSRKISF